MYMCAPIINVNDNYISKSVYETQGHACKNHTYNNYVHVRYTLKRRSQPYTLHQSFVFWLQKYTKDDHGNLPRGYIATLAHTKGSSYIELLSNVAHQQQKMGRSGVRIIKDYAQQFKAQNISQFTKAANKVVCMAIKPHPTTCSFPTSTITVTSKVKALCIPIVSLSGTAHLSAS